MTGPEKTCGVDGLQREQLIPIVQRVVEEELTHLRNSIDDLHARLTKVSRPPEPTPVCPTEEKKQPVTCELADWIRQVSRQIAELRQHIDYLREHLEL